MKHLSNSHKIQKNRKWNMWLLQSVRHDWAFSVPLPWNSGTLGKVFKFTIDISVLEIIFGLPNENNDKTINLYNYIILYAKYYIYA
jgi:hypothetical protein